MTGDADVIRAALLQVRYATRAWDYWDGILAALDQLVARITESERKAAAYDAARATVKIEGNTRAYYVLRAEAAEARVHALERATSQAQRALQSYVDRDLGTVTYPGMFYESDVERLKNGESALRALIFVRAVVLEGAPA